jgi:hypothetical protein
MDDPRQRELLEMRRRVQELEGRVAALTARLDAETQIEEDIDRAAPSSTQRRLTAIDRKVEGLGGWLSDMARRLVAHQAAATDVNDRLTVFGERFDRELSRERTALDAIRVRETQLARLTDGLYKDGLAVAHRLTAIEDALGLAAQAPQRVSRSNKKT